MLYIGTTLLSLFLYGIYVNTVADKLDNEGYKISKEKKSKYKKRNDNLTTLVLVLTPGLNLIVSALVVLMLEKVSNHAVQNLIDNGRVVKKQELDFSEEIKQEDQLEKTNTWQYQNIPRKRSYSDLSIDEKLRELELEKRSLLRQQQEQILLSNDDKDTASAYNRGAYTKKQK